MESTVDLETLLPSHRVKNIEWPLILRWLPCMKHPLRNLDYTIKKRPSE